jgi:hypothetical protein
METPNIIIDEKTKRYKAGDVVMLEYTGKDKPCKKAMAVLLTPFTVKDAHCVGDFRTLYAIDTDKERFLKAGPIGPGDVQCKIAKVRSEKLKAWYFGKILEQCMKPEPKNENIWVLFDESLDDYTLEGRRIRVYKNEAEARKVFHETVGVTRKVRSAEGWEINEDEDFFEAYPDGSWGASHETVELKKCKIGETMWCHN